MVNNLLLFWWKSIGDFWRFHVYFDKKMFLRSQLHVSIIDIVILKNQEWNQAYELHHKNAFFKMEDGKRC